MITNIILAVLFLAVILLAALLFKEIQRPLYVISIDEIYKDEDFPHVPEAFRNKKNAQNRLADIYQCALVEFGENWTDESSLDDGNVTFYKDGEYLDNHYSAQIFEIKCH